jgi:protein-S-isoprenylcysteine O-methyltransferase Ste14
MNIKLLKQIAGVILIIIGLLAFFTPLTPGSWLVFVGAELAGIGLLSRENILKIYGRIKDWWSGRKEEEPQ